MLLIIMILFVLLIPLLFIYGIQLTIAGNISTQAVHAAMVMPPTDGYYTDFTFQVLDLGGTNITVGFGDIDSSEDINPNASGDEISRPNNNAIIFTIEPTEAESTGEEALRFGHTKRKVHAKRGKPLTFIVSPSHASDIFFAVMAQFVPKNGSLIKLKRKESVYPTSDGVLTMTLSVPHDMIALSVEAQIHASWTGGTGSGVVTVEKILPNTDINESDWVNSSFGDIGGNIDDGDLSRSSDYELTVPIASNTTQDINVKSGKFTYPTKGRREFVPAGTVYNINFDHGLGSEVATLLIELMVQGHIVNSKKRKFNVFMGGNNVIPISQLSGGIAIL